jgi:hypothetical protein
MKQLPCILLALAVLPLLACGSKEEGLALEVAAKLVSDGSAESTSTGVRFVRADGAEIVLEQALLTVTRLELQPCPESAWNRVLRNLSPIGTAHAHSSENPRVLEAARVLSLTEHRDTEHAFHEMAPTPAKYCAAKLTLAPADDHTHGVPEGVAMTGRTLMLKGTFKATATDQPEPFEFDATGTVSREYSFDALSLSAEEPHAKLLLELAFDRWLDGYTPATVDPGQGALESIAGSTRLTATR